MGKERNLVGCLDLGGGAGDRLVCITNALGNRSCTKRCLIEFVREPDPQLGYLAGPLTMGMLLSLPMVLVGIGAVIHALRRNPA